MSSQSSPANPDGYLFFSHNKNNVAPLAVSPSHLWSIAHPKNEVAEAKIFYGQIKNSSDAITAIVSLGDEKFANGSKNIKREIVRKAVATGVQQLRAAGARNVAIDLDTTKMDPQAAAVGATLGLYKFTTLRTKENDKTPKVDVRLLSENEASGWDTGLIYAQSQNFARELMELPANIVTPTSFCEKVKQAFEGIPNVQICVRDAAWAEEKGMRTFLSVAKGSAEPCKFLEIHYNGAPNRNARPLAFVGKGVTFDSGGISLKPAKDMKAMRADMGGAATVAVSTLAIAKSKLPINVVTTIPLTENLPGPTANKPGDVIYTMNGKTVEIDNTDAEGRLILADALYYTSSTYRPHTLVDVATLTGAVMVTLSDVFSGVFTNSDDLWNELNTAGEAEFDRMWRLPLDEEFGPQIRSSNADLCNTGGTWGGSCTAALFLKEFVDGTDSSNADAIRWAHIDIGGTMEALRAGPYTPAGMTGRPTRKNTHGIPTSRQTQPNQNRERRQRQQQQQQHNNNSNSNNNINHNNQHRLPNSSDNVDLPSSPVHADNRDQRLSATRQQQQQQYQPHIKAPVIVRQPSIFTSFSRNLRSFLPLSSTALPPVVTGAGVGGTNITLGSGTGVGGRRRPLSLGSPHTVSASGRSILSAHGDGGSVDEECIISAHWCDVEDLGNINYTRGSSSRWLVIVYASGVQIWDTSNLSSVREVVNLRNDTMHIQGPVLNATILPAPSDDVTDQFTNTRPLIGVLTSSQFTVYSLPTQSVVEQISFSNATQFVARPSFIVITSIHPSTLHILSASSLSTLHTIHLPTSIYPSTALSLRLLAYTSPPPPNLHSYNSQSTRNNSTFISRDSQRREKGERYFISSNSLRDSIGTSVARVGGEVWSGMKALAAASPINIGDKSGSGGLPGSIGPASSITDDTHWGYSKSAPATTMSAASLASNTDPNLPSSLTTSGANWITVLDLKPLLNGELPRVVSRFAPFSSDSKSRGEISKLWFGAGGGTGATPMLCVAPREGQRVSVFQIRLSRRILNSRSVRSGIGNDSTKPNSASPETNNNDEAKLEMPLHWYDLRRGLTSAKVENVTWDRAGKWVGISTARRTVHIFAPNPYGGKTDRQAHFQTNVPNAEQLQPLSTELSPVVRLRPFENPRTPFNTPANNTVEHNASLSSLSFIFLPASISNTLPLSLLPHSSSHSPSPASSLPRLSSSSSPQLHAAPPKRPFQDILVFDSNIGEMVLYRVALEWTSQGSTVPVEHGASVSSGGYGNTSGYSFSFPASPGATKKVAASGISTVTVPQEEGYLIGKDSVLATWNLKRARDWPEVKDGYLFERTSPVIASEKKKDFSDFIAQAELSPFSLSPGILPKSIYLCHQFSFYTFSTWDYHALLNSHQLGGVIGREIVFRHDVEISGTGSDKDNAGDGDEEMVFGFGDAVDLQGGSDVRSAAMSSRHGSSRTDTGRGTFDIPIATAIHSEIDYSSQSPPTIPMFPNGMPAATGIGGRSPTSRILDHGIPPPLRRGAVTAGAVAAEGFGRIRREVGSMIRSPVLRPVRIGASERRRSMGGTSVTTSSSVSISPSPRALEPMPLEFDESDEVFLEDGIEGLSQSGKDQSKDASGDVGDTLKVVEGEETTSTSGSAIGLGSGASASASVSTPRTQPDEDVVIEWSGSQGEEAWDDEARATVAEAEMFDEISVAGFMDEDMGLYQKKK